MKILAKAILVYLVFGMNLALADEVNTSNITTFQAGTPAVASEVNGNFSTLIDSINDNADRIDSLEGGGSVTGTDLDADFYTALLQYASGQRIVFVTSGTFTGDLVTEATTLTGNVPANGLEAGDMICQYLADTNLNPAVLGKFVAWLSDTNTDAKDRIHNALEYQRVDGALLSYSLPSILNNDPLLNTPNVDEAGTQINTTLRVWTNTNGNGVDLNNSCNEWTTDSSGVDGWEGVSNSTTSWTAAVSGDAGCSILHRLYCFQQ